MKFKSQPYNFLLLAGVLAFVLSFFKGNETIDIHLHDTYYVFTPEFLWRLLFIFFFIFWIIYKIINRTLFSARLTKIHVLLTIITLLGLMCFWTVVQKFNDVRPRRYLGYNNWNDFISISDADYYFGISMIIFILAQLLFLVNLTAGLLKPARK